VLSAGWHSKFMLAIQEFGLLSVVLLCLFIICEQ